MRVFKLYCWCEDMEVWHEVDSVEAFSLRDAGEFLRERHPSVVANNTVKIVDYTRQLALRRLLRRVDRELECA